MLMGLWEVFKLKCRPDEKSVKSSEFILRGPWTFHQPPYLGHVDDSDGERLVAQNGSVLVPLPPLQHHMQMVHVSLQEVRILKDRGTHAGLTGWNSSSEEQEHHQNRVILRMKCVTCSEKVSSSSVSIRPSGGRRYSLDLKVRLEPWERHKDTNTKIRRIKWNHLIIDQRYQEMFAGNAERKTSFSEWRNLYHLSDIIIDWLKLIDWSWLKLIKVD